MGQLIKVYALLLGSGLLMFAGGLHGLLLPIRGGELGFSVFALGLIGTGWSAGFIAGSILVPRMVRRTGHIRAFSVMAALAAISILLNLLIVGDWAWIVLRVLSGAAFAGAAMIVESWLNEVTDNSARGFVFSLYTTANFAGVTAGQLALSLTGTATYLPFVLGAIFYALALMPSALSSSPQPQPLRDTRLDLKLVFATSPVGLLAALSVGIANGTFGTLAPVYGLRIGLDSAQIALLMSLALVAGAVSQVPFGRLSDRIDRRLVIAGAGTGAALAGLLLLVLDPSELLPLYLLFGLYGLCAYPIYAVAVAHANDFAKPGQFGAIASGMLLLYGIGLAIGPVAAAFAMEALRPVGLFAVTAAVQVGLALFALVRMRMRRAPDDGAPFQAVPLGRNSTPETATLDPRAENAQTDAE